MIPTSIIPLANHLWECTVFLLAIALAVAAAGPRRARLRYALWFAASVRLLIPVPSVSGGVSRVVRATPSRHSFADSTMVSAAQPFRTTTPSPFLESVPTRQDTVEVALLFVWLAGFLFTALRWLRQWRDVRRIARLAVPGGSFDSVPVAIIGAGVEPCVIGILRPLLLLPEGLAQKLSPTELSSVLAHEICHVRRRDNLTASIHAVAQSLFWFYPPVWWIGRHLLNERECACDQAVLNSGRDPEIYASGIVAVCRHHLTASPACAAGVGRHSLSRRVESIMRFESSPRMSTPRALAFFCSAFAVLAEPLFTGFVSARLSRAQALPQTDAPPSFAVASIKPNRAGEMNSGFRRSTGGQLNALNITVKMLIAFAWDIPEDRVLQAPPWFETDHFDILAKPDAPEQGPRDESPELTRSRAMDLLRLRTQALLTERFGLKLHRESRQHAVYNLVVEKGGPRNLHKPEGRHDLINNGRRLTCVGVSMEYLAKVFLTPQMSAPVVDRTGIEGEFDFTMQWTPDGEGAGDSPYPSFSTALREQLGLRLEPSKGLVEYLVVESARRPDSN